MRSYCRSCWKMFKPISTEMLLCSRYYQQLTLNVIAEAAFGISLESSNNLLSDLKDIFAKGRQEQPVTAIMTRKLTFSPSRFVHM